jgi:exodeoxyribonuclease V alpha subunit
MAATLAAAGITTPGQVTEEALTALPQVTARRASRLYLGWVGAGQAYELAELVVPQDIPARWVTRLTDAIGDGAAAALRADPWRLLVLPDATVAQADRLAVAVDGARRRDDPRRARALVDWTLARFAREGHTAAPVPVLGDALTAFGLDVEDAVAAAIAAELVVEVADPTGAGERWVARVALARAETTVADRLLALAASGGTLAGDRAVAKASAGLDAVQATAVAHAAAHGVSVLTGGPGTGKSRTVAAMVELARMVDATVALAAPTGRAAKRLAELAGDDATTVHRLLGARRGAGDRVTVFEHDADNPVRADLVVVDEVSMLDVELAAALLAALPDSTHLVLVGDPAQLPSIGSGRVLGDVLQAGVFPVTELSTLYRQTEGGAIARLATAVRAGELPSPDDGQSTSKEVVIVPATGSAQAARRVVQLVTDSIPRVFGLSGEQIQVVTPVHRGPAGTAALNRELKAVLNPGRGAVRGFDAGDRVVATANYLDAEPTGYANGEVGTVLETGEKSVLVGFPGGQSEISGKALNDLQHGWAITVHRAQGSEWDAVVAVLPPEAGSMLSRPLVYTALTRARHHLSVVHAAGPVLARAVRHVGARPRRTRLAALLEIPTPQAVPV